jgi:hypothetical protein
VLINFHHKTWQEDRMAQEIGLPIEPHRLEEYLEWLNVHDPSAAEEALSGMRMVAAALGRVPRSTEAHNSSPDTQPYVFEFGGRHMECFFEGITAHTKKDYIAGLPGSNTDKAIALLDLYSRVNVQQRLVPRQIERAVSHLEGYTYVEIAQSEEQETTKSVVFDALKYMKKIIARELNDLFGDDTPVASARTSRSKPSELPKQPQQSTTTTHAPEVAPDSRPGAVYVEYAKLYGPESSTHIKMLLGLVENTMNIEQKRQIMTQVQDLIFAHARRIEYLPEGIRPVCRKVLCQLVGYGMNNGESPRAIRSIDKLEPKLRPEGKPEQHLTAVEAAEIMLDYLLKKEVEAREQNQPPVITTEPPTRSVALVQRVMVTGASLAPEEKSTSEIMVPDSVRLLGARARLNENNIQRLAAHVSLVAHDRSEPQAASLACYQVAGVLNDLVSNRTYSARKAGMHDKHFQVLRFLFGDVQNGLLATPARKLIADKRSELKSRGIAVEEIQTQITELEKLTKESLELFAKALQGKPSAALPYPRR